MAGEDRAIFPEVRIFRPDVAEDRRGTKYLSYGRDFFRANDIPFSIKDEFIYSIPEANTLYGIHYQGGARPQSKLISLIAGSGMDYVIDLRRKSPSYKKWYSLRIDSVEKAHVFVPRGFGHAFYSLEPNTVMLFRVDESFDPDHSKAISYRDDQIDLDIRGESFILSDQDRNAPSLAASGCDL